MIAIPLADLEDSLHHVAPAEQHLAIGFRELRMRRDEGLHDGTPTGKRTLQDEVVDDVDELGFINIIDLTAGACPECLVKLPREAPRTGELDQLALEVTAMIQQTCCLGRRGGVGHGISAGAAQPSTSVRKHLSGGGSNGRRSRHLGSRASCGLVRPQHRDVRDEPPLEGLRLDVGRNVPGVHGQAIHVNDPGQRVLRGYIGTLELRREVTDPQEVADLPGFAAHGALGHAERRTELISGHAWLARGVGQEVDMSQCIHHPSRPRGTAAGLQRRGPLARQLRHRPPGEIGVLLVEDR
jgi:hypothetical protein